MITMSKMADQHGINWHRAVLKNDVAVKIRPIQETDAPYLIDIFDHLSSESRYQRFHRAVDNITQSEKIREALRVAHDGAHHGHGCLAFTDAAEEPDVAIGGVRYYQTSDTNGELAITIRDDYQAIGLGYSLLMLLIKNARSAGLQTISGLTQYNNSGMWQLLKRTNLPLAHHTDGGDCYFMLTL